MRIEIWKDGEYLKHMDASPWNDYRVQALMYDEENMRYYAYQDSKNKYRFNIIVSFDKHNIDAGHAADDILDKYHKERREDGTK